MSNKSNSEPKTSCESGVSFEPEINSSLDKVIPSLDNITLDLDMGIDLAIKWGKYNKE